MMSDSDRHSRVAAQKKIQLVSDFKYEGDVLLFELLNPVVALPAPPPVSCHS